MRIVHYVNQFFGGLGGEEQAGTPLEGGGGAVGPDKLCEQLFGGDAKDVTTLVCGDNYAVEKQDAMVADALEKVRQAKADLFVAGPCFQAGRYGMAAGALCSTVQSKLAIPVITGMADENPGADLYRAFLYIVDSGANAARLREVLMTMANLARKIMSKAPIGSPKDEGYLTRGLIRDQFVEKTAGERLGGMGLAEGKGGALRSGTVST